MANFYPPGFENKRTVVAIDFDGVIHMEVTKTDKYGHRHPTFSRCDYPTIKFDKIIDLIKTYHQNNYKIGRAHV